MHRYMLEQMALDLVRNKLILPKNKAKVIKSFETMWENHIALIWSVEDVISCGKEAKKKISKNRAREILHEIYSTIATMV